MSVLTNNKIKEGELKRIGTTTFCWYHENHGPVVFRNAYLYIDLQNIQHDLQPEHHEDENAVWNELVDLFHS